MSMFKHPERVTLNLVLQGQPFDRFVVTKSSWENLLQKLSEKDLPKVLVKSPVESQCTA